MSTVKTTNLQHPSAANPAIVLDAAGGATVAGMGLVLVSPTSIANSGGSASASGGQVTFTGVSSISLNGVFTSTYENYRILVNCTAASVANINRIRFRSSGADATGNIYYFSSSRTQWNAAQNVFYARGNPLDYIYLAENDDTANDGSRSSLDILSPNVATVTTLTAMSIRTAIGMEYGGAFVDSTTQYDGITLFPNIGTITGTIRVYGYKNS